MVEMTDDSRPLTGPVALVTGAGGRLGQPLAVLMAERGAAVLAAARSADQPDETVRRIEGAGGRALALPADLAAVEGVEDLAEPASTTLGPIEVMDNNAATVGPPGPTAGLDWREVRAAFDLNVVSVVRLIATLPPSMTERGWGRVVNMSSGIAARPGTMGGRTTYTATKGALEDRSINLPAELDGTGVTVNVFRPGTVDTRDPGPHPGPGPRPRRRGTRRALPRDARQGQPGHPRGLGARPRRPAAGTGYRPGVELRRPMSAVAIRQHPGR